MVVTELLSEMHRNFQSVKKSELREKKEFLKKGTHHVGLRKFLQFQIIIGLYTNPITYKLVDYNDEDICASFYEQELQKATQEMFRIEKVIRRKRNKSLVKWLGYPNRFSSWVPVNNEDLIKKYRCI